MLAQPSLNWHKRPVHPLEHSQKKEPTRSWQIDPAEQGLDAQSSILIEQSGPVYPFTQTHWDFLKKIIISYAKKKSKNSIIIEYN